MIGENNTHIICMTHYSLLDLVNVPEGHDVAEALRRAADIGAHAEKLGYKRYWAAEHHGMDGIGSAATSVVLAHVGVATSHIRIGAGGIMLPNHAPLVIAEQFGTLDALFPGRIDLGLGRAPGSDGRVSNAIRRNLSSDPNAFPRDVMELMSYFADDGQTGIRATPGAGADVALYILGSSLFGAQMAAHFGLPYAFASHFAPDMLDQALAAYRSNFQPSRFLDRPYAMAGYNILAAETDERARFVASSMQQSFVSLRTGRGPRKLPPPVPGYVDDLGDMEKHVLNTMLSASAIGAADKVEKDVSAFLDRTGVDELVIVSAIHDHEARRRSLEIAAAVMDSINEKRLCPAD